MTAARRAAAAVVLGAGLASAARLTDDLDGEGLNLDDFLPLCDASIVESTCQTYFGGEDGNGLVGPQDVKPVLSATADSMNELWAELHLAEGQQVTCADLCNAITETIKRTRTCPPRSDVGCYFNADGEEACDVDVRPDTIKQETRNEGDLPDYNDESTLHVRIQDPEAPRMRSRGPSDEIDYVKEVAVRRAANLFRIYPSALVTVDNGDDEDDAVAEELGGHALLQERNSTGRRQGLSAAWKQHIQRVNVKAMAYVQTALQRFHKKNTRASIEKWYGPGAYTNAAIRTKLGKTLNSVNDMLGNVEYVMGPECSRSTFAYVYPSAYTSCKSSELSRKPCTKNNKGQFIFYICQLTLDTHLGEQIETLTHEGSHHAFAYTDDVDFEGGTAYGRHACAKLAKRNWKKAMKNADNFCYYVQDVTDGV